jgi:hypothetical protein
MYRKNKSINGLKNLKYRNIYIKSIEIECSISLYIIRMFGISPCGANPNNRVLFDLDYVAVSRNAKITFRTG